MIPEPICKDRAVEMDTGKEVAAYFLKHNAEAGEAPADDCYITISKTLDVGAKGSDESGLYPPEEFRKRYKFLESTK